MAAETPAEYWGVFLDGPQPSEMFIRLNLALIEFARATTSHETLALPARTAIPLLTSQQFYALLPIFSRDDPQQFFALLKQVPVQFHDRLAMVFYESSGIPVILPGKALFTRKDCQKWIIGVTRAYPDEVHANLNKLLQGDNYLPDPLTEKPFMFREIPRSCFPPTADLEQRQTFEKLLAQLDVKLGPLMVEIQQTIQTQAHPVAATNSLGSQLAAQAGTQAGLEAAHMRYKALHGQVYYDSQGKKKYQGGAFDTMDKGNF
ncbi:hypothetical protein TWF694_007506 [Orbilia ellipsospora]|uniref:Uncharacterized protein n=1 Tax=Orbilia ellipsospora TaxID=2528407 RepID=A0AAV9XPL8_9PEZI